MNPEPLDWPMKTRSRPGRWQQSCLLFAVDLNIGPKLATVQVTLVSKIAPEGFEYNNYKRKCGPKIY
jgi:hypothetical protein